MHKYWSTERPLGLGCYPTPAGNEIITIRNFERKTYCEKIGRAAYGFICYEKQLDERDKYNYELIGRE